MSGKEEGKIRRVETDERQACFFKHLRELLSDMAEHIIMLGPLGIRCVQVKPSAYPPRPLLNKDEDQDRDYPPLPKSQSTSSPSIPAPRGEVSGKSSAIP